MRSQDKVNSVSGTQITPAVCECGHPETGHRPVRDWGRGRCRWYLDGGSKRCQCQQFRAEDDGGL